MEAKTMTPEEERKARRAESQRKWREKNREALRERNRQYRANLPPEEAERQRLQRLESNRRNIKARLESNKRAYKGNTDKATLWNIKSRAKKAGLPFNLTIEDVTPPEYCPILGIKLERGHKGKAAGPQYCSPSVDRIIPELGYVKGNVIVISQLANAIKQNATPEQIRKVADFYERLLNGD